MLPLLRHELRLVWRDRWRLGLTATVLLLGLFGVWNGSNRADGLSRYYSDLADEGRHRLESLQRAQTAPSAFRASTVEHWAVLEPTGWTASAVGLTDVWAPATTVYAWKSPSNLFAEEEPQNPAHLQAGALDVAFLIVWLLPLVAIAWTYDALSRDREDGVLALALAQPIRAIRLLSVRLIVRFAVVAAPFAALMLAALGLAGASLGGLDSAIRTGLWLSVVFLYLAFWFSAAGVVNTFRFGSTTNGIILFGLWVGLTGIAPSAIDLAARRIAPVPTRAQILNAEREGSLNTWEAGPTVLAALHRQRPEFRPSSDARDYDAWRAQITAVYMKELETAERILGERRRSLDHRIRWTRRLAFLSPAALASLSLNTIAGTGSEGMFSLRRQAETFVAESRQFFFPKILRGEALSERDYQQIPVFRYRHASGGERAKRTLPYITGLVAFALFATGILACRRSFC